MRRALLILALMAAPASAETRKVANLDATVLSRPGPVARLFLAQELYFQGLAAQDALALIQSARMMQRVGVVPAPDRVPEDRGKMLVGDAPSPIPFPLADATLLTAETLAMGDDLAQGLIDAARSPEPVPRGAVRQSTAAVAPGGIHVWTLAFFGATTAEIAVLGNGQSTLSITIADETGQAPCATVASADRLYCRFTPKDNGPFTVTVANPGKAVDAYRLITN